MTDLDIKTNQETENSVNFALQRFTNVFNAIEFLLDKYKKNMLKGDVRYNQLFLLHNIVKGNFFNTFNALCQFADIKPMLFEGKTDFENPEEYMEWQDYLFRLLWDCHEEEFFGAHTVLTIYSNITDNLDDEDRHIHSIVCDSFNNVNSLLVEVYSLFGLEDNYVNPDIRNNDPQWDQLDLPESVFGPIAH